MSTETLTTRTTPRATDAPQQTAAATQLAHIRALVDTAPPLGPQQVAAIRRCFQGAVR